TREISSNEPFENAHAAAPRRNRGRVRSLPARHRRRQIELPQHDDGVRYTDRRDPLGACARVFLSGGRGDRAGAAAVIAGEIMSMVVLELTSAHDLHLCCGPLATEGPRPDYLPRNRQAPSDRTFSPHEQAHPSASGT